MLQASQVSYSINNKDIIQNISIDVHKGEFIGIIGPNGSGKSTFLKHIYRVLKPKFGTILLNNVDIFEQSSRQIAQTMAVLSQESSVAFDFTVVEIVLMGRSPHKRLLERDSTRDMSIVEDALTQVNMLDYMNRNFMSLSGGEKQRVLIARSLAQQATIIILDEPTNHLDIKHQLQIMDLLKRLDITVLAAIHDLNIAATYCDRICVIDDGEVVVDGLPTEVLTKKLVKNTFGVEAEIQLDGWTGRPHISFIPESTFSNKTE